MTEIISPASPIFGDEERDAVDRVIRSGMLAQGPEVAAFEHEFAHHLVAGRTCVAVSSGTSGLHLGLLAAGVGPGDEVIVPSFTFAATANAVALTGATPIFADINPATFCLDPRSAAAAITDRTVALLPVHLYGQPADMTGLLDIAQAHGLSLFEDAAQAHGASWDGQPVGSFGRFAMFSLYPTKNMTSGEGGMVSCDGAIARQLRLLRNQGMERRYENEVVGFNARMTDLHAAIGRVQLTKLAGWNSKRQSNARFFDANLSNAVVVPPVDTRATHVYHQYTIRVPDDRDAFAQALADEHFVGTGVYYPIPTHQLPSFRRLVDLPHTNRAAQEVLSLPVHPALSKADLERIVTAVNVVAKAGA